MEHVQDQEQVKFSDNIVGNLYSPDAVCHVGVFLEGGVRLKRDRGLIVGTEPVDRHPNGARPTALGDESADRQCCLCEMVGADSLKPFWYPLKRSRVSG